MYAHHWILSASYLNLLSVIEHPPSLLLNVVPYFRNYRIIFVIAFCHRDSEAQQAVFQVRSVSLRKYFIPIASTMLRIRKVEHPCVRFASICPPNF